MTNYTVRFDRGNRGWTCSVFALDASGVKAGRTLASGTGHTQQAAKEDALATASAPEIRAALTGADHRRPHWVQGAAGERQEAERKAAASEKRGATRSARPPSAR
jgi:hypothetical protein